MYATVPLAGLKACPIKDLPAGTFFYSIPDTLGQRQYFLRVDVEPGNHGIAAGVVTLDDTEPCILRLLSVADANLNALPVPVDALCVRLEMGESSTRDVYVGGNLFVTDKDTFIVVKVPGMGGSSEIGYVSTTTWKVTREHPTQQACFQDWELLSRAPSGTETVLLKIGA